MKVFLYIASAAVVAGIAYAGHEMGSASSQPAPALPPAAGPTHATAVAQSSGMPAWLVLAVAVAIVGGCVLAAVGVSDRRPAAATPPAGLNREHRPLLHHRWHVILEATHPDTGKVELRRGPVELTAASHVEVQTEVIRRYLAQYGPMKPGVKLGAKAVPMTGANAQ